MHDGNFRTLSLNLPRSFGTRIRSRKLTPNQIKDRSRDQALEAIYLSDAATGCLFGGRFVDSLSICRFVNEN